MKTLKISIALLAALAIVLGYAAYTRNAKSPISSVPQQDQGGDAPESYSAPRLTPAEERALQSPKSGATAAEQEDFAEFLRGAAEEAPYLELYGACAVKPVVLSIKEGRPLRVKNTTSAEQTLVFSDTDVLRVPAYSTQEFDIPFARGGSIYAYGCAYAGGVSGRLVITK